MNTGLRRIVCLLIMCLLLCLPTGVFAESFMLYVGAAQDVSKENIEGIPVDTVRIYKKDQKWYLFLPAGWNTDELRVYFTGTKKAKIADDEYVEHGGLTDAFQPGTKVKVKPQGSGEITIHVMQSKNLPSIFIRTVSGTVDAIRDDKTAREAGYMFMRQANGTVEYDGKLQYIKSRGNATFYFNKKPWQIKLEDGAPLCGMDKDKKWILLANYVDKSLVRNSICLDMARASGVYAYVPEHQAVDLYINNVYWGSYLLTEKNEVDSDRLDITNLEKATEELNSIPLEELESFGQRLYSIRGSKGKKIPDEPDDVTGGYLVLADTRVYFAHDPSGFVTSRGQAVTIQSPKYASEKQVKYVQTLMQSIEDALFATDGIDPATGKHYTDMLDFTTFVHRYVQAEVTGEHDGQRPYFYKDSDTVDGMMYCAPVWDLDNTFGAFKNHASARRFYICNDNSQKYYWFVQAMKRPEFKEAAIKVYHETYEPMLRVLLGQEKDPRGILRSIEEYGAEVAASAEMDNIRWPISIMRQENFNPNTGTTPAKNIEYLLGYVERRMEFLNKQWGK